MLALESARMLLRRRAPRALSLTNEAARAREPTPRATPAARQSLPTLTYGTAVCLAHSRENCVEVVGLEVAV